MAKQLWADASAKSGFSTYAKYETAVKAAEKLIGDRNIRYVICATADGRFFPVALGQAALDAGLHFKMCFTN